MPDTKRELDPVTMLRRLLDECDRCRELFDDNASLLVENDCGTLTNEQTVMVLVLLSDRHRGHE